MLNKESKQKRNSLKDKKQDCYEIKFKLVGYAIIHLYANQIEGNRYGDVFLLKKEVKKAYPNCEILQGYGVLDLKTNKTPDECLDWHFTYDSAKKELLSTVLNNVHLVGNYVFEFNDSKENIQKFLESRNLELDKDQVVLGYFYHLSTGNDIKHRIIISAVQNQKNGYDMFFEGPNGGELVKIDRSINDYSTLFKKAETIYTDMYF